MNFKRLVKNPLIIIFISSIIILIFVSFAISQQKQPEKILFNASNNCWDGPQFNVGPDLNRVSGQKWLGTVTIDIYDPEGFLLHTTQSVIDEWGNFDVWLEEGKDIQPGYFVTVTDVTATKELVVTSLAIIEIDMDADTVSGTTGSYAQIRVDGGTPQDPTSRNTTADGNGYWIVNFSVPQDGNPTTWDLVPGSGGVASEADYDCDETSVWWGLPLPGFQVNPVLNRVCGYDWLYADTASIYIYDDDNLSDGWLWSVENVDVDEWGYFDFWLGDFDIQRGHFVTVTDGITTKEHKVTTLTVDEVNIDANTVSGTAEHPNAEIRVDSSNPEEPNCRHGWANEERKWTVDFNVPQAGNPVWDIVLGSAGRACERDADGDETLVPWPITNESPIAVCKDIEIPVDENCQVSITAEDVDGGSYDPDDDTIKLSVDNTGPFLPGEYWVNLTVTDSNEASDTCQAKVTVVDATPPNIQSLSASPNLLWPPNHKMVEVILNATAYDRCDTQPKCQIIAVSSNEPVNGLGDGDKAPDWEITGNLTVNLRAERSGTGSGRVYTITVECIDSSGNSSTEIVEVTVPHDKKK